MSKEGTCRDVSMLERYKAAMVLAGAGDAIGYKRGDWEFCHSGQAIHDELQQMGGLAKLKVDKKRWPVSDDTVMHLATADGLIEHDNSKPNQVLYCTIAKYYKECMHDMAGRAPGMTCMSVVHQLKPNVSNGYKVNFNPRGGGCGASMRAMCIGLRYPRPEDVDDLIAVSVESGRMSHHHPTGFLGSLASALFTAYSIQGKPPIKWAAGLMEVLEKAKTYIKEANHFAKDNLEAWPYFESAWDNYIRERKLETGTPYFPEGYDTPPVRDQFYKKISYGGWGGASGHDSSIIAYDAILGADGNWEELCKRGMFHGGDSDSTGTIAGCCYGAMYGFQGVPENNYEKLEYRDRLETCAKKLYTLGNPDSPAAPATSGSVESGDAVLKEEESKSKGKESETEHKDEAMESLDSPAGDAAEIVTGSGSQTKEDAERTPESLGEDAGCDQKADSSVGESKTTTV